MTELCGHCEAVTIAGVCPRCVSPADVAALLAERDDLRAEVERLRAERAGLFNKTQVRAALGDALSQAPGDSYQLAHVRERIVDRVMASLRTTGGGA